jgi:HemX protein
MLAATFHGFSTHALSLPATIALHGSLGLFVLAAVLALAHALFPHRLKLLYAEACGWGGTLFLLGYFLIRFAEAGTQPFSNLFEVVAFSCLCTAAAYLTAARLKAMKAVGAFVWPAIAVVFVASLGLAASVSTPEGEGVQDPVLVLHIVLVVLAFGAVALAAVAATMALVQERVLKRHRDPPFIRQFPPLETLRKLVNNCVLIALPLLTAGFLLGVASFTREDWSRAVTNPKILSSVVLWVVLVAAAAGRWTGWLYGRRHHYVVLCGFGLVIVTYVGLALVMGAGRG